ncbi:hypothetical protein HDU92_004413 [Lobulomyces angularis]|nr:hypothetical protein HDU92_004413 [Lobulomyces angularis]
MDGTAFDYIPFGMGYIGVYNPAFEQHLIDKFLTCKAKLELDLNNSIRPNFLMLDLFNNFSLCPTNTEEGFKWDVLIITVDDTVISFKDIVNSLVFNADYPLEKEN